MKLTVPAIRAAEPNARRQEVSEQTGVLLDAIDTLARRASQPERLRGKPGPRNGMRGAVALPTACSWVQAPVEPGRQVPARCLRRPLKAPTDAGFSAFSPAVTGDGDEPLHGANRRARKGGVRVHVDQAVPVLVTVEQRRRAGMVSVGAGRGRRRVKLDGDLADRVPTATLPPEKLVVGAVHVAVMPASCQHPPVTTDSMWVNRR